MVSHLTFSNPEGTKPKWVVWSTTWADTKRSLISSTDILDSVFLKICNIGSWAENFSLCWKSVFGFEFEFACTICNLTKSSRKKSWNVERIKKNWHKDSLKYWVWIKLKCLSHIIENNMVTEMCFTYWLMRTSRAQTQLVGFKISQPCHLFVLIRRTCCHLCATHINIGIW